MATTTIDTEALESAFNAFNEHSGLLELAYRELQAKVAVLADKLAAAQSARHVELLEKERLGHRLQRMLEALPGALLIIDDAEIVREHNSQASVLFDGPLTGCTWQAIVAREFSRGACDDGELELADGRWLSLARQRLERETGEILLLTDITERRRMAKLVQRHQRLSSIGEMSARLAHQIKTPLASALLYASQLETCPTRNRGRTAHKLVNRLHDLNRMTDDMLSFAGGASDRRERVDIAVLLHDVVDSIKPQLTGPAHVAVDPLREPLRVDANRGALKGALLNLVSNALQSGAEVPAIALRATQRDGTITLTVTDNGRGIDERIMPRLFEPFFTTRPQGTGLGLAVVRSVADAHGGDVEIETGPRGTSVAFRLPETANV